MRVLVVEDDPRIGADLAAALDMVGYRVERCADGEEAWFLGDTEDYDLIVLDLGLPRLDGLTVLKRWRANGREMPVLVLTARGTWLERVEGIDAGADDYPSCRCGAIECRTLEITAFRVTLPACPAPIFPFSRYVRAASTRFAARRRLLLPPAPPPACRGRCCGCAKLGCQRRSTLWGFCPFLTPPGCCWRVRPTRSTALPWPRRR